MADRIAENGAVQQAITDADASVAKPSGLGAAGWIAGQMVDIKAAGYTTLVNGLTGKGRLINQYVTYGSSAVVYDPTVLFAAGELGLWYDPSDFSTMFQDSAGTTPVTAAGQPVGLIQDKSGRGNHATASGTARPVLQQDGNGKYYLDFDGTNSTMATSAIDLTTRSSLVFGISVYKDTDTAAAAAVEFSANPNTNNGSFGLLAPNGAAGNNFGFVIRGSSAVGARATSGHASPIGKVLTCTFDIAGAGTSTEILPRVNGVEPTLTNSGSASGTGNFGNYALYLGKRGGTTLPFNGRVYGLIIRAATTTTTEIEGVENWLANKQGITLPTALNITSFSDTGTTESTANYIRTSPFAQAHFTTTATSIEVEAYSDIYSSFSGLAHIGIWENGAYKGYIAFTADGSKTTTFTGLTAGSKTVTLVNGPQSKPSSSVIGSFVKSIKADDASIVQTFPTATNRILVYGDSISVGAFATIPMQSAWDLDVRAAYYTDSLAVEAYGYRSLYDDCVDATARSAFVSKLSAYSPSIIWLAIGTNDYGLNKWSAASFGTAYAALLDDIHTALPSAAIYCQSPIVRTTETANGSGSTLGDYRTQISNAASARSGYCTYCDGSAYMLTSDLTDGVHPNTTGHGKYATAVKTQLGI